MKTDKFTKVCLVSIIILLIAILLKPLVFTRDVYARSKVEYKVVSYYEIMYEAGGVMQAAVPGIEKILNQYAKESWNLVCVDGSYAIFER